MMKFKSDNWLNVVFAVYNLEQKIKILPESVRNFRFGLKYAKLRPLQHRNK